MPPVLQWIAAVVPPRYYIQAMRNVIMEEVGRHEEQFRDDMDQRDFFKYMLASTGIGFKDGRKSVVWNRENEYFVNGIVEIKMLKAAQSSYEELTRKVDSTRFLITYKEQWLRSHQILNIDGDRVRLAEQSNGRVRLEVRSGYGVNFYYPKDIGEAKLGDWVIVKKDGASENCLPCESREKAVELSRVLAETFEATCEKLLHDSKGNSAKYIKQKYNPITIENPIREGAECLRGLDVEGDDYLKTFKFRGGEFGNWLNGKERQITLNAGYEGLMDLAQALGVTPESIGLGGKLAIAFGARGHGNALAHYEKLLNVINLTKMKGSGALAHEYGHAMDFYLRANGHEDWVRDVVKVMQFKKVEVESKVDQEKAFDKAFNNAKSWLTYSRPWYNMDDIQRDKALEILKIGLAH